MLYVGAEPITRGPYRTSRHKWKCLYPGLLKACLSEASESHLWKPHTHTQKCLLETSGWPSEACRGCTSWKGSPADSEGPLNWTCSGIFSVLEGKEYTEVSLLIWVCIWLWSVDTKMCHISCHSLGKLSYALDNICWKPPMRLLKRGGMKTATSWHRSLCHWLGVGWKINKTIMFEHWVKYKELGTVQVFRNISF